MKKVFFILLLLPHVLYSQRVVVLSVNQPPELGFSVSKQDTTIVKGSSVVLGTDLIVSGGSGEYQYNWSPSATLDDSTSIHPMATPPDTTTYILTVTDNLGCSFSVSYGVNVKDTLVNNQQLSVSGKLKAVLYPNPNDGTFKLNLTGVPADKIELTILDNAGKVVKKRTIRNFTGEYTELLQLNLESGIYTILANTKMETLSRKFVIH